jgi:hypothetical protein
MLISKAVRVKKRLVECTGLGEAKEVILVLGTYHLVFDKLGTGAALGVGILSLLEPVRFTCLTTLIVILGNCSV